MNQGARHLPRKEPRIKKSYFQVSTNKGPSTEFVKHAYELLPPNNTNTVLMHYLGDEKAAKPYAHGNAKDGAEHAQMYVRTCPSVLRSLEKECKISTPAKAYRNHVIRGSPSTHHAVKQPCNIKQVKNVRSKLLGKQRLSHDTIYNLHEIAVDMPDFIHVIRTHSDLICVCGHKSMFDKLDRLLLLDSPSPQLLSYDKTFQLGDFYVSTLAFRHTLFKEVPVIPVCFLLHERKFQECHDELFSICCKMVPSLRKTKKPIVTDEEQAFINTIKKHLPLMPHKRCWNHIFQNAVRWLRSHGAPSHDISVYLSDLRELFHLSTKEEYEEKLDQLACKWSAPFHQYYLQNVHTDIESIAQWAIDRFGSQVTRQKD